MTAVTAPPPTPAATAAADAGERWLGCRCCGLACRLVDPAAGGNVGAVPAGDIAQARAEAGEPLRCPRCAEPLPHREALGRQRTWALLLASMVAYVPANLLPIMTTTQALQPTAHTIFGGIIELWTTGDWVLAIVVFVASIAVPMLKLAVLTVLVYSEQHAPRWRRHERAVLYRLVDAVGHWSMLDVYVVVLLSAMVDFGKFAAVSPEPGLLAFAAVVVLTLLTAHSVDPQRIWREPADGAVAQPPAVTAENTASAGAAPRGAAW